MLCIRFDSIRFDKWKIVFIYCLPQNSRYVTKGRREDRTKKLYPFGKWSLNVVVVVVVFAYRECNCLCFCSCCVELIAFFSVCFFLLLPLNLVNMPFFRMVHICIFCHPPVFSHQFTSRWFVHNVSMIWIVWEKDQKIGANSQRQYFILQYKCNK